MPEGCDKVIENNLKIIWEYFSIIYNLSDPSQCSQSHPSGAVGKEASTKKCFNPGLLGTS